MIRDFFARGVLYWLRAPRVYEDLRRDEWVLALARLLISICCLAGIFHENGNWMSHLYQSFSISYLVYSLGVMLALLLRHRLNPGVHAAIQCVDLLWAVHLSVVVDWPGLSFALFFFIIGSSAFRWGFWETQLSNGVYCALLVAACAVYHLEMPRLWPSGSTFSPAAEIAVCLAISVLAGILAEARALRAEAHSITTVVGHVGIDAGLEQALQQAGTAGIRRFGGNQVLIALRHGSRKRSILFRITGEQIDSCELDPARMPLYFFPAPADSWRVVNDDGSRPPGFCQALDSRNHAGCG